MTIYTHQTLCRGSWRENLETKSQSSLPNIYFFLSGFQSSLLYHSLLLWSEHLLMLHQSVTQNLSNKWSSTSEISAMQLCSITEIMAKSLLSCVNRSNTRYSFRAGAKKQVFLVCNHISWPPTWPPWRHKQTRNSVNITSGYLSWLASSRPHGSTYHWPLVADLPSRPLCRINPADDNKNCFFVLLDDNLLSLCTCG